MRDDAVIDECPPLEADAPPAERSLTGIVTVLTPALALAACGGGGIDAPAAAPVLPPIAGPAPTPVPAPVPAPPAPAPSPAPAPVPPTATQAARLLGQATMGATRADIARVQSLGYDGWLTEQFATPRATAHWDWLITSGYNAVGNRDGSNGFNQTVWRQLISGQDQLRQRVGLALLDTLVISVEALTTSWRAFAGAAYLDILWDNAFGNYRELLERVSTSPAMGNYLTFIGNRKANATTGAVPDENYARELMQLFTLGVNRLNPDGSVQTANGRTVESYVQEDVSGLARVFTGFNYDSSDSSTPDRLRRPLTQQPANHELGVKTFLGTTIPAGTDGFASLRLTLDAIFAHPNVPPFVARQLIQRLVTSNPSATYVGRVAAVFTNNGGGVRGDMKTIIRAILLDPEARADPTAGATTFGKLRDPVVRLTNWARAFGATSPGDLWAIGDTSSSTNRLAQSPGRAPSVFNHFRPGYAPPNTPIATQGLVAPELQITTEPSVIAYVNYMQTLIASGTGDIRANYAELLPKAGDAQALVDDVNLLVAAGQLSAPTVATIKSAVESIATTATNGPISRVYTAILLVMASPEYLTLK